MGCNSSDVPSCYRTYILVLRHLAPAKGSAFRYSFLLFLAQSCRPVTSHTGLSSLWTFGISSSQALLFSATIWGTVFAHGEPASAIMNLYGG
jgi:hypothetical protein